MTSSIQSRLGTAPEEGCKAPVKVVANTPITLSGEQTISSTAVVAGDRVLVNGQVDLSENGIYDVSTTAWSYAKDWNKANDVIAGMLVPSSETTDLYQLKVFSGDYTAGTTEVEFQTGVIASKQYENQLGSQAVAKKFTLVGMTYIVAGNDLIVERNGQVLILDKHYTETSSTEVTIITSVLTTDDFVFRSSTGVTLVSTTTSSVSHIDSGDTYNLGAYLNNRFIVSVLDHGATGDNSNNDTLAVQEAIDTGKMVYFPTPVGGGYFIPDGITLATTGQRIFGDGRPSRLRGNGTNPVIKALGFYHSISDLETAGGTIGIQVGDATHKANQMSMFNIWDTKSTVALEVIHGNSGRLCQAYYEGDAAVSTDKAVYFSSGYSNTNGWFTDQVRIFDKAYGYHMAALQTSEGYHNFSCEDYEVTALQIDASTSIRNEFHFYAESDLANFPACKAMINNSNARSNRMDMRGALTGGTTGLINGMENQTAPVYHITENLEYNDSVSVDVSGTTKTIQIVSGHQLLTVNNTGATGTLDLTNIDQLNIGVEYHLLFPSTNTGKVHIDLSSPTGYTFQETGDDRWDHVSATGRDRFLNLKRISELVFTIEEATGNLGPFEDTTIDATTSPTASMVGFKANTAFNVTNTSGLTQTLTLSNLNLRRGGSVFYFYNNSVDIVNLTLSGLSYVDTTTNKVIAVNSGLEIIVLNSTTVAAKVLS